MEQFLLDFKEKLHGMAAMSLKDWSSIEGKLRLKKLMAGQFLGGPGNSENYFIYVCEGLFREQEVNHFKELITTRYLVKDSVFFGINSSAPASIQAIKDSSILVLSEHELGKLEYKHKAFRKHFKIFLTEYIKDLMLRADILSSKTGKIRYERFYSHYEEVCKYQPLAEQAGYLAMNKDTVYRLRANHFPDPASGDR